MERRLDEWMTLTQGRFRRLIGQYAASLGLQPGQGKILEYLTQHDGCTQNELGAFWDLDKSTVSGLVARMERDGLLVLGRDENDRRCAVVRILPRGRELSARMQEYIAGVDARAWAGVSEADRAVLVRVLGQIFANLDETGRCGE